MKKTVSMLYGPSLRRWAILLLGTTVSMLIGCVTQQINTKAMPNSDLPLSTNEVLLVYEKAKFPTPKYATSWTRSTIKKINQSLEKAVGAKIPSALRRIGINSRTELETTRDNLPQAQKSIPWIYVTPVRDNMTCLNFSSTCSHRLTVAIRLLAADTQTTLWTTEIQEPYMVSSFVYDQRYEELAEHISKAILGVVRSKGAQ